MAVLSLQDITDLAPELDLSSYSATTISGMINQAQVRAESFSNVKGFDYQLETDETDRALINNNGELQVFVRRRPVVTVSAISINKGSFSTNLTLTQGGVNLYQIPYPNTQIVFPNSYFYLTGTYLAGGSSQLLTLKGANTFSKTTYYGGYQTYPYDLKYAVLLYFRDIVAKRFNPQGLASFSQGSYSENYGAQTQGKSRLILEAEDLLTNGGFVSMRIF